MFSANGEDEMVLLILLIYQSTIAHISVPCECKTPFDFGENFGSIRNAGSQSAQENRQVLSADLSPCFQTAT